MLKSTRNLKDYQFIFEDDVLKAPRTLLHVPYYRNIKIYATFFSD